MLLCTFTGVNEFFLWLSYLLHRPSAFLLLWKFPNFVRRSRMITVFQNWKCSVDSLFELVYLPPWMCHLNVNTTYEENLHISLNKFGIVFLKINFFRNIFQGSPPQKRKKNGTRNYLLFLEKPASDCFQIRVFNTGLSGLQKCKTLVIKQTSLGDSFFLQIKFLSTRMLVMHITRPCHRCQFHWELSFHSVCKKDLLL